MRSVVDLHLSRQAGEKQGEKVAEKDVWLVGDKCTVADLSWFIWEQIIDFTMTRVGSPIEKVRESPFLSQLPFSYMEIVESLRITWLILTQGKYPHYEAWYKKMEDRPTAQQAIESRNEGLKHLHLPVQPEK